MFTTYVLKSRKDGKLYIGSTEHIENRLKTHNAGKVRSTKWRRPFTLVYSEEFGSKTEARQRENFLKSGQGRKFLKSLLKDMSR